MHEFDNSIANVLRVLVGQFGPALPRIHLVRDVSGQLVVVLDPDALPEAEHWSKLARTLHQTLGIQSPGEKRVLLKESDLISEEEVADSQDRILLDLQDPPYRAISEDIKGQVWLIDRLITNQDWIRPPVWETPPVPTAVAYSIKGGVGRTTTLALWAWYLARNGHHPILVDFDIEAPGLGSALLPYEELPDYGLIDWLIECILGKPDSGLLQECIAPWRVPQDASGSVRIIPAYGRKTKDYVAKLGRVFVPFIGPDEKIHGFAERVASLLEEVSRIPVAPTEVLIDSRAGLHDIGSAIVTRLAAEVFLFSRDDMQSWYAYKRLFSHLSMGKAVQFGNQDHDIRSRMKMVAAQLDSGEDAIRAWTSNSFDAWAEFYDEVEENQIGFYGRDDEAAPHYPLLTLFDLQVRQFNLSDPNKRPDWRWIDKAFSDFFEAATARLGETRQSRNA